MSLLINQRFKWLLLSLACIPALASAEMQSLSDNDLSEVDGRGIGIVLEDFIFSHGHDESNDQIFRISGLTDTDGNSVTVNVDQMYIAREGSRYGEVLNPVNLGRLTNPFEIDLIDGDDVGLPGEAVLQFAAPTQYENDADGYDCLGHSLIKGSGTCSSRPSGAANEAGGGTWDNGERADMGVELQIIDGAHTKNLNFHAKSAVFDGSHLRLWGDDDNGRMAAEFRLNFYTPELEITTCTKDNQGCGSGVKMRDFEMELALGHSFQPLYFGVDSETGGLSIEIAKITHDYIGNINSTTGVSDGSPEGNAAQLFFEDYYVNQDYRSNISFSDIEISGTSLGSAKVEGILVQYLDVKFRDLTP